jgi:hypothetical protein
MPTVVAVSTELPATKPTFPILDSKTTPTRTAFAPPGDTFRQLTERNCLLLAAANTTAANLLDEENRIPASSSRGRTHKNSDELWRTIRYFAALELRNYSAADALERYFQLADAETRTELLREGFPIIEAQIERAMKAKAAGIKFPLELGDLTKQHSQMVTDREQGERGSRLLNLDLKRRLGLPSQPETERLWPTGEFVIDPTPPDVEQAVNAALADRPELRGLRALYHGLTPETLQETREYLQSRISLLGQFAQSRSSSDRRFFRRKQGPDPETLAELEVRRKQILELTTQRERAIADETRAAVLRMTSQVQRVAQARDRLRLAEEKLADAVKKRMADQPGAEFLEAQARSEVLKARADVVVELTAWHQARVRLKAAQGWLAWEAAPDKRP